MTEAHNDDWAERMCARVLELWPDEYAYYDYQVAVESFTNEEVLFYLDEVTLGDPSPESRESSFEEAVQLFSRAVRNRVSVMNEGQSHS